MLMAVIERILVPTDFSDTAAVAMTYATELANRLGATLHVIHVIEDVPPTGGTKAGELHTSPPATLIQPIRHEVLGELQQAVATLRPQPLKVTLAIRDGNPLVDILRYVRDHRIDLIVVGTHGRGPLKHLLLGSVAESLVRQASCAVLTVRHPQYKTVRDAGLSSSS